MSTDTAPPDAWLVGLAVSGGAYLLVARRAATRAAEPAVVAA
ncbi:hypothetical protein [Nonomuraea monospora]